MILALADNAVAEPFEDAVDAYFRGDFATTIRLMGPLAEKGDVHAQTMLGGVYLTRKNYTEALKWYLRAANQGDASSQSMLCGMYYSAMGVRQDYEQAMTWCRRAGDQGDADAQFLLGALYYKGLGVPQNYVQAHVWFNLAAANPTSKAEKRNDAIYNRDLIAGKMTRAQVADAQKLAAEWKPKLER